MGHYENKRSGNSHLIHIKVKWSELSEKENKRRHFLWKGCNGWKGIHSKYTQSTLKENSLNECQIRIMFLFIQQAATENLHQIKVCTFLGTELHLDVVLRAAQACGDKRHHRPFWAQENFALRRMPRVKTLAWSSRSANYKHFDELVCYKINADSWPQQAGENTNLPCLHNASYRKQTVNFTNKLCVIRTDASWTWHLLNLISQEHFSLPELYLVSLRSINIKKCSLHFVQPFQVFPLLKLQQQNFNDWRSAAGL